MQRVRKIDEILADKLDFEDIKYPVNIKDIHKVQKKSKKCYEDKYGDLLLIGHENKKHFAFIKNFNTFMYYYTLHCGKNICCLQVFNTEQILKCHVKNCFKINGKQRIIMLKKVNTLSSDIMKNYILIYDHNV